MRIFGNIIWLVCGGLIISASWAVAGLLWCMSFVGIPWGMQCFKFARMFLAPMGLVAAYEGGFVSNIVNIIWTVFFGIPLALEAFAIGCALCTSIIGIPWGLQCFKIAKFALAPFGTRIIRRKVF